MERCLFALILVVVGSYSCAAWESTSIDTIETRYPNGQLKEQYLQIFWGGNETTEKTGFYRSWYHNGQLEWEGCYDQDMKIGNWVRWDSTGWRAEEVTYVEGRKQGNEIEWNNDGTVKKWLHHRNGKLHGRCSWLKSDYGINGMYNNPDMTLEADQFYLDGTLITSLGTISSEIGGLPGCGLRQPYHNSELDIWIEQPTRNREYHVGEKVEGKREGIWTVWAEDGSMIRQEHYEHGERR